MPTQHENFRQAIQRKNARILAIKSILDHPLVAVDSRGRTWRSSVAGRQRLAQEMLHLEEVVADLERQDARLLGVENQQAGPESQKKIRGSSVRARERDPRKKAIAEIKRGHPGGTALEICKKMDQRAERRPGLQPPQQWGTQLWVTAYRSLPNKVRTYISKIKAS